MSIQTVLWDAMRGYDDVPISRRIRDSVNQKTYNYHTVKTSFRRNVNLNRSHWIAFLNSEISDGVKNGYFMAIYTSEDRDVFYVTLSQGYKWIEENKGDLHPIVAMRRISNYWRRKFNLLETRMFLSNHVTRETENQRYQNAGTIFNVYFDIRTDLSEDNILNQMLFVKMLLDEIRLECNGDWQAKNLEILNAPDRTL